MDNPFFTVYIPFHTEVYADAAKRALDSLEAQFFQSFEVIMVVNGADIPFWCNPVSFLTETRAVFGRRVVAGRFHTLASASNAALAQARGSWFMRLDADDVLEPDALAEYVRVISRIESTDPGFRPFVVTGHWDDTGELYGGGLAIPTDWLRTIGGYDSNRPLGDGRYIRDVLKRSVGLDNRVLRTGYKAYIYRKQHSSMTRARDA